MVPVVPCVGYILGSSGFVFFLRRCRKSVRILKLKVPVFCGSDGISWKGHVTRRPSHFEVKVPLFCGTVAPCILKLKVPLFCGTVAPRILKLKVPLFCGSDGIS